MPGKVLRVSAPDASGTVRLTAQIEQEEGAARRAFLLREHTYSALGAPVAGDFLSDEELSALAEAEGEERAREKAVELLSYGDNSQSGLYRKLRQHGYGREASEGAVAYVVARGYLREREQALRLVVREAQGKYYGPRRISAALHQKGYPTPVIQDALREAEAQGDVDFAALRQRLLDEKLPPEADATARRKLLYRYGY